MRPLLSLLDEPYRSRAVPPGSARYLSWLFAATEARGPLLGIYALMAEWRALMDPTTDASVAHIKLAWWRDEMRRLAKRSPAHPITRYLAAIPSAAGADLASLEQSVAAAAAQVAGAPLERADELAAHSFALYGIPLRIAGQLAGPDEGSAPCIAGLATAAYLSRCVDDYGREVRAGRVPFPVDELLSARIEDADLAADEPPPPLSQYLSQLRERAAGQLEGATSALRSMPSAARSRQRHLSILAALGTKQYPGRRSASIADFRLSDLYNAWTAARHAARGR